MTSLVGVCTGFKWPAKQQTGVVLLGRYIARLLSAESGTQLYHVTLLRHTYRIRDATLSRNPITSHQLLTMNMQAYIYMQRL